jgi:DNA polymerase (family X)
MPPSMKDADRQVESEVPTANREVARVLHRLADLLEFKDEDLFKLRAYRSVAETIEEMRESIAEIADQGGAAELQKLPGIGKSISTQILEILETGTSSQLEELKAEIPETVLDLRRVSGIGLKTSQVLYRDYGIKNLADLKAFAEGGGLLCVPWLGEKTIHRIQTSLAHIQSAA